MKVHNNISLQPYNTFGIDVITKMFATFSSEEELSNLASDKNLPKERLIVGGGSNMLFTKDYDGIALKNNIRGIEVVDENEEEVIVRIGAGENWHELVLYAIDKGWAGIENMSLIPGTVGAAPMQNIGAYGVEIKDVFHSLQAFHWDKKETHSFSKEACEFGYRWSVFKGRLKGQYVITSVTLRLSKKPEYKVSYGDIKSTLEEMQVTQLSLKAVSEAVISIRQRKLPDPKEIGNAGSFFKNPEISQKQFDSLKEKFPSIVGYPTTPGIVKVPAGWLIDQAGWKGKKIGNIGVHKNQALVLVNYGGGKGEEIWSLAMEIKKTVKSIYGVDIEPEVNIY